MKGPGNHVLTVFLVFFIFLYPAAAVSKMVEYDLTIEKKTITIHGRAADGMTINGMIPGPVLKFTQGDFARIRVHNKMDTDTSIHWHGILVPPDMDGVPNISFPPIKPGQTYAYEFPIRQSGTYWYHSHTHLQEQQGLYGSIVIAPKTASIKADRDQVLVLSDWTTESPDAVLRTLKSGSEWYSVQKGSSQSIFGAAARGNLGAYFKRELQRMPPMDIADVAYDYFLVNGSPETVIPAAAGETLRIRIINGSATTYFFLEFSGGPMQIISADGQNVEPIKQKRFLIGVAETYDVLIRVPASGSYELRATAHDGSGWSSTWIGAGMKRPAPDIPKPDLYAPMGHGSMAKVFSLTPEGVMGMTDDRVDKGLFDKPGMMGMGAAGSMAAMDMSAMEHAVPMDNNTVMENMSGMDQAAAMDSGSVMPVQSGKPFTFNYGFMAPDVSSSTYLARDGMSVKRPWPPYALLRSGKSTALPKDRPVRELRFTLDGDMERYVWFLNKKPLSETDEILIREGEIVRFIMINRTMMHHPMHLHGHFFRVVNGQGDHSPLKHTVDVAPMSTTVIEFIANEVGDWFFHCHLLYHMKSGMARKFHYENYEPGEDVKKVSANLFKDPWVVWGKADVMSHMTEGFFKLADTRNTVELEWEAGWQDVDATLWEGSLTLDRSLNRFFSVFAGGFMEGEDDNEEDTKGIAGFQYLLPMNIHTRSWVDTHGEARFLLEKDLQLTPRLELNPEIQYDTKDGWESGAGVSFLLYKQVSLIVKWHSEYKWGAGLTIRF